MPDIAGFLSVYVFDWGFALCAAVAVLAAVAYIALVRKPLEGSETLILTERPA
mgnify:CR=1 FL=1